MVVVSHYKGSAEPTAQPLAFVGKGVTFDSGGISLKPGAVRFDISQVEVSLYLLTITDRVRI